MSFVKDKNDVFRVFLKPFKESHKDVSTEHMMEIADQKFCVFEFLFKQLIPAHAPVFRIFHNIFGASYIRKKPGRKLISFKLKDFIKL